MLLNDIEQFILLALQRSISQQVIGLANLSSVEQMATRQAVKAWLGGEPSKLNTLLKLFPATGTYAIAHAFAEGTPKANGDSKSTWESVQTHLGVMPQGYGRFHLHEEYGKACKKLGLHFVKAGPEVEEDDDIVTVFAKTSGTPQSGYLINPMKFQAGVLPTWTEHLAETIRLELSHGALDPDPDDPVAVRHFCDNLMQRIPEGQVTLYKMMESAVGTIVIAALLQAKEQDRYDLIPPHLREPLRKAFEDESIRGAKTRRPRLTLNPHRQQLILHLPAVTRADNPVWEIRGPKPTSYDAGFERTVILGRNHLTPSGEVKLALLRQGEEALTQSFHPIPSRETPVTLFDGESGKLIPTSGPGTARELKPGKYHLLVENQNRGYAQPWGEGHEHIELPVSPMDNAVEIDSYGQTFTFSCQRNPWVGISSESELRTADTRKIHHPAHRLTARAYIHEMPEDAPPVMLHLERTDAGLPPIEITMRADEAHPGHFLAEVPDLAPLKPGPPARLLAVVHCGPVTCSTEFLYWQGFRRMTEAGLECDRLPVGTSLHGLEWAPDGLLRFTDDDEGRLRISGPGIPPFELIRPGLTVRIHDAKRGIRPIPNASQLAVSKESQARLLVRIEGRESGEVRLSGMQPIAIDSDHPYNRALADCFVASGRRTRVELEVLVNGRIAHRATIAENMTARNMIPVSGGYAFEVDAVRTGALRLELVAFADGLNPVPTALEVEPDGISGEKIYDTPHPLIVRWNARDAETRRWSITIPDTLRGVATLVRIGIKRDAGEEYAELRFAENAGDSDGLIWLRREIDSEGKSAFGRLLTNPKSALVGVPAKQLMEMTGKLSELTLHKYPSAVWADIAKWLPQAQRTAITLEINHGAKSPETIQTLLGQAAAQFAKKSRPGSSVFASLMIGAAPRLLAYPANEYAGIVMPDAERLTEANLTHLIRLGEARSVRSYLLGLLNPEHVSEGIPLRPEQLAQDLPFSKGIAFFQSLLKGDFAGCPNPGPLKLEDYLMKLRGTTAKDSVLRRLAEQGDIQKTPNLLSAEHVYACLRQMEDRLVSCGIPENEHFAPFRRSLSRAMQYSARSAPSLKRALNVHTELRVSHTEPMLKDGILHWKSWTVNPFVSDLEQATFLVAGLARLNARNRNPQEFENQLQHWLGDSAAPTSAPQEFVNNIACIAPEWLTLSLLIWELALRND